MDKQKKIKIPFIPTLAALVVMLALITMGSAAYYTSTTTAHSFLTITASGPFWSLYDNTSTGKQTLLFSKDMPEETSATYGQRKDYGWSFESLTPSSASDVPWLNSSAISASQIDYVLFADTISPDSSTAYWFSGCSSLESIGDAGASTFAYLDTSNVTNMSGMFAGCTSLTYLDLSSITTASVTTATGTFTGDSALSRVNLGANWSFNGATSSRITGLELPAAPDNASYEGLWYATNGPNQYTTYTEHTIPSNVAAEYTWSGVRALTLSHSAG